MRSIILAGDIGATKTILALYHTDAEKNSSGQDSLLAEKTFRNNEFSGFPELITAFLAGRKEQPVRACFGVAGPVRENRVRMTNLDWNLDGSALAAQFGMEELLLVNDLVATTAGIASLPENSLFRLNQGRPEAGGNIGVLAVGTGLGQAFAVPDGKRFRPFPTEGGHASFAPRNQEQIELLQFLLTPLEGKEHAPHVSAEQVCSGMVLPALYAFQLTRCQEPEWMREKRLAAEPDALTPLIVAAADSASTEEIGELHCEPAVRSVQLMLDILAAEAANLALKVLATDGIFLGGGMLPRLLAHIDRDRFLKIFCRGIYQDMLADIPIHIIMEPKTALIGARQLSMKTKN